MSLDYETYNLGDVKLRRGATLRDCKLVYKTFGSAKAMFRDCIFPGRISEHARHQSRSRQLP